MVVMLLSDHSPIVSSMGFGLVTHRRFNDGYICGIINTTHALLTLIELEYRMDLLIIY